MTKSSPSNSSKIEELKSQIKEKRAEYNQAIKADKKFELVRIIRSELKELEKQLDRLISSS